MEVTLPSEVNRFIVNLCMARPREEQPWFLVVRSDQQIVHPESAKFLVDGENSRTLRLVPRTVVGDVDSVLKARDVR